LISITKSNTMNSKLTNYLALLLVLIAQISFAQERTVTGTVTDNSGLPLPGVSILVKGTSTGTQTDFDGKFSLVATPTQVLIFSYVGMKQQEIVASSTTLTVKMADDAVELEGVVVTALGIKRKEKSLGYATQTLKGSETTEARESNIINSLSGKIAGVQITSSSGSVGSSSRITLRGISSITGNTEPLFIVDGVPMDNTNFGNAGSGGGRDLPNGISNINPDDVESIEVLKGPTAAALYGIRAGNGAIIITTKKGKYTEKLGITFNSNVTMSNPLILPNYQNSYGQGGDPNGGSIGNYFEYVDGAGGGFGDGVDESWGAPLDVGLEFVQWDSFKNGGQATPWVSHPDNVKNFFNTGVNISNSLAFQGGNEKTTYRMSVGNSDQKGMVPNTDFKKVNVGFNGSHKASEKLTTSYTLNYVNEKSNNLPSVGYNSENVMQQFIWSARNVNFPDLKDWRNLPLSPSYDNAAALVPINWNNNFQNNPYWVLANNKNTYGRDRIFGNVGLDYSFSNKFSVSGKIMLDQFSQQENLIKAIGTNETIDGSFQSIVRNYRETNVEFLAKYRDKINDDFAFSINAGSNNLRRVSTFNSGLAPALELPFLYNLSNLKTGSIAQQVNSYSEQRINSVFTFGDISYKDALFFSMTARNDWSSVLAKANNSFFYYSGTVSAVFTELFDIKSDNLTFLKLRGGYSKVGRLGEIDPYNINTTFILNNNGWGNQATNNNTQFNPNAKPENVISTEIGFDLYTLNNKVKISATYYNQKSQDLLIAADVDPATTFTSSFGNFADMENRGFELQLGISVIKEKDYYFDIDLNFATNRNRVTSLGGLDSYELGGQWGVTLQAQPGQPFGLLVGRGFERNDAGQIIYENGLPVVDDTQRILGDINPDWTGGINLSAGYKNFSISTLVDAKIGGDIHSMSYAWGRYSGVLEETLYGRETGIVGNGVISDGNGGWVPNNVVTEAKSFNQTVYGNNNEESAIFDASYIKLRELRFGYDFPKKWFGTLPIDNVKFSVVARNIAILYKKTPHIDPESGFSSSNNEQGQEFGQLPSARNIGFNLNVQF
jgi:TonB-linked SusC/RagA family outer membrane protein